MKSIIITKDPRGLFNVTILDASGDLHDHAGFVSAADAFRWAFEFTPSLEPFNASDPDPR